MWPTSERFRRTLRTDHFAVTKVEVLQEGEIIADLTSDGYVVDGSVTVSRQEITRTASITLVDYDGRVTPNDVNALLAPVGTEMRLWRGVQFPDATVAEQRAGTNRELVPLGVFRFTSVRTSGQTITIDQMYDRAWKVQRTKLEGPLTIAKGTLVTAVIELKLHIADPTIDVNFPDIDEVTPQMIFDPETDIWSVCQQLASNIGYRLYFDQLGAATLSQEPDPNDPNVAWVFDNTTYNFIGRDETRAGNLMLADTEIVWEGTTYNGVVVIGENSSTNAVYQATARDLNPNSATLWGGPYGKMVLFIRDEKIASQAQALARARQELQKQVGLTQQATIMSLVNPAFDVDDVVQLKYEHGAQVLDRYFLLDSVTIPLRATAAQQLVTRVLQDIDEPTLAPSGLPKAATLTDDFHTLNTVKWPLRTAATVVGWRGRLTLPAAGSGFAIFSTSPTAYDMVNSYVYVEFAMLPTAATSSTYLQIRETANTANVIFIGREGGNLLMREVVGGVVSDTTLAHDPLAHRWGRLLHDGTNLLWQTSINGTTWTTRRTKATLFALASVTISIESGWLTTAGAGRTEIAHFNTTPVTALAYNPPPYHVGVLRTIDDFNTDKADDHYAGGDRIGQYEIFWDRAEGVADGTFSSSYATQIASETATIRSTGLKLTLGLGLHYPPTWISGISDYRFKNESAAFSTQTNFVFNELIRNQARQYFAWINTQVGFSNVWSIRLTSGGDAEALYPGGGLWGYDANAIGGANLPATVAPSPYPTWTPGTGTTTQADEWYSWYLDSLVDAIGFQMRELREVYGYTGWFEVLTPGSGLRPSQLTAEIANRLAGYQSVTGVGAVWHLFYQRLIDRHGVVAYCSSMADNSGTPVNDVPTATDVNTAITDSSLNSYSAYRWVTRIANEFGLPNGGENPGRGGVTDTYYQDTTSSGLMSKTLAQSAGGKALSTYWAHGDQLWGNSTLTFTDWTTKTAALNTTSPGIPPNPPG